MTTKFSRLSHERLFNLDSLERSHWRNRINQLKRELRESPLNLTSTTPKSNPGFRPAPAPRRRPAR